MTDHLFIRIKRRRGDDALYPLFRCVETGAERTYGCLQGGTPREELEELFGPLDARLRARGLITRKAA